jgi:adenylate kinase
MIQERLSKPDARAGFILDGFPRNIPQAQALDAMLARLSQPLQLALLVDVDTEVLMKRLTGRRTCSNASCGAIYNIYFSAPSPQQVDKCGSPAHRSDDNGNRASRLRCMTSRPRRWSYYKAQGKLRTVRGTGSVNEIFKNVTDIIESQIRPLADVMGKIESAAARQAAKAKTPRWPGCCRQGGVQSGEGSPKAKAVAPVTKPTLVKNMPKKAAVKKPHPRLNRNT